MCVCCLHSEFGLTRTVYILLRVRMFIYRYDSQSVAKCRQKVTQTSMLLPISLGKKGAKI